MVHNEIRIETKLEFGELKIKEYDEKAEETAKIKKVICLKFSFFRHIFFTWALNILSLFIIQLCFIWWPTWEITLDYDKCESPVEATHFAVYALDNDISIIKKKFVNLKQSKARINYLQKFFSTNYFELSEIHILNYKLFQYLYNANTKEFLPLHTVINCDNQQLHQELVEGLNQYERSYFQNILGECLIEIQIKSILQLIMRELSDPFYLFQIFSVLLWVLFEGYFHYAAVIIISTVISISIGVYETLYNLQGIKKISEYSTLVNRKNKETRTFEQIDSKLLAPGDVIEVPNVNVVFPCDCILINGTVVVNESILTGESIPIVKSDLSDNKPTDLFDLKKDPSLSRNLLYTGTRVIQKRGTSSEFRSLAVVYSIGFNTEKGNLIRNILNPKEQD